MAEFKLSQQQINKGGGSRGLSPTLISPQSAAASASAGGAIRLDPNAANIGFTPYKIPEIVKDTTAESIHNFAQVTLKAAQAFEDRESSYFADQAVIEYNKKAREGFYGTEDEDGNYVPGFNATKGATATTGYSSYKAQLDKSFQDTMESLEPRVRQKALIRMESTRQTLMGQAATHRATQLQVAQEEMQYAKQKNATFNIMADPSSIYRVDPITKMNGKEAFYTNYESLEKADKAWADTIQEVGEFMYLETAKNSNPQQAAQVASAFYQTIGKPELLRHPKHLTAMGQNIQRWEREADRDLVARANLQATLEDKADRKMKEQSGAMLVGALIDGDLIPKDVLVRGVKSGAIKSSDAESYWKSAYKPDEIKTDLFEYEAYFNMIVNGQDTGNKFLISDKLTDSDKSFLRSMQKQASDPDFQDRMKRGKEQIDAWLKGKSWEAGIFDQEKELMVRIATNDLYSRLASGKQPFEAIMQDLDKRYNTAVIPIGRLPALRTGIRPENSDMLIEQKTTLDNMRLTGELTDSEYYSEITILNNYRKAITQVAKKFTKEDQ